MVTRLIKAHTGFMRQHPHFPLLSLLQDDITQMQSQQVKSLPKVQKSIFCISLLWLTRDSLTQKNLSDSALGQHITTTLKSLLGSFSTHQQRALADEYNEWRKTEALHASPTSVIR